MKVLFQRFKAIIVGLVITTIVIFPEFLWHFVVGVLHLAFEWIEFALDFVIELVFETGLHNTQIIVFYILGVLALIGLYFLAKRVPKMLNNFQNKLNRYRNDKKAALRLYWQQLPFLHKVQFVTLSLTALTLLLFFGI